MTDITMPQLGETVTEGTITRWYKKVGDPIAVDEPLFEVSTDKVDSEVPSSVTGFVSEILVAEGETVDVGVKLAVITTEVAWAPTPAPAAPARPAAPAPAPAPGPNPSAPSAAQAPKAESPPPPPPAPTAPPRAGADPLTSGKLLSPVVRKLVVEHGLDVTTIAGTGQGGRITRDDVLAHVDRNGGSKAAGPSAGPSPSPPPSSSPPAAARPTPLPPGTDDVIVGFSNIRRRTAEHMIRSQATAAHVLVATEVDYSGVERVRLAEREGWKAAEGFSLTYLPFISRAAVDALEEFPHVNASVGEDQLVVHRRINLGFAVDLSFEGLIVPVVHDADQVRLRALARSIAGLAARARAKELSADDITGGTFTITNPGPYGTFLTFPVINQPQVAILSTDGIRKKPVVVELPDGTDTIGIRPVGMLGLSFDHRAFDGAYASAFLARVKDIIETRDWSQEI